MSDKDIKIIYLVGGPLSERWLHYYCLDELSKLFSIEYWDCSGILSRGYDVQNPLDRPYVLVIENRKHLQQLLQNLSGREILMPEVAFKKETYSLFKQFSKYIHYCVLIDIWTSVVDFQMDIPAHSSTKTVEKNCIQKGILERFIQKLCRCINRLDCVQYFRTDKDVWKYERKLKEVYTYMLLCEKLFTVFRISYNARTPYSIHHPDYLKYLELQDNSERIISEPYIVFISQYYPYHADINPKDFAKDIDQIADCYYASLNSFFDKLENEYHCRVVIAEHPSGKGIENRYGGRDIYYYKTAELIRDSVAVCMHSSNAIAYVALYNKPMVIFTNEALGYVPKVEQYTLRFAQKLGIKIINVDQMDDVKNIFIQIDEHRVEYIRKVLLNSKNRNYTNAELYARYFREIAQKID